MEVQPGEELEFRLAPALVCYVVVFFGMNSVLEARLLAVDRKQCGFRARGLSFGTWTWISPTCRWLLNGQVIVAGRGGFRDWACKPSTRCGWFTVGRVFMNVINDSPCVPTKLSLTSIVLV